MRSWLSAFMLSWMSEWIVFQIRKDQVHKLQRSCNIFSPFFIRTPASLIFNKESSASPEWCSASSFHNTTMSPQTLHWDLITLCIECLQIYRIWGPKSRHLVLLCKAKMWDTAHVTLTMLSSRKSCAQTTGAHRKRYAVLNLMTQAKTCSLFSTE